MKKLITLFLLSVAFLPASAQLMVNKAGQVRIGKTSIPEGYTPFGSPQRIVGGGGSEVPLPEVDSLASLVLLGPGPNGSRGYMTFGKGDYVGIGEVSVFNTDVLTLIGRKGLNYITDTSSEVFRYTPANSRFQVNCDIFAYGMVFDSDSRLKQGIKPLSSAGWLDEVTPVSYTLCSTQQIARVKGVEPADSLSPTPADARTRYGFLAQEVQKVLPELVVEDENGVLGVDYIGFIPLLVDVVKRQNEEIAALRKQVDDLNAVIANPRLKSRSEESGIGYDVVKKVAMSQNIPNPFGSTTKIELTIPETTGNAFVCIYDLQGKLEQKIDCAQRGTFVLDIDGSRLTPGMYIYSLMMDGEEAVTKRMIVGINK